MSLVSICKIASIGDHPAADRLSLVQIDGHTVITMKDADGNHRFDKDELVFHVKENSIVPEVLLKATGFWNEADGKGDLDGSAGNRVTNRKVRGIVSEGLIWKFNPVAEAVGLACPQDHFADWKDVSAELGITEHVPEMRDETQRNQASGKMVKFPSLEQFRNAIRNVQAHARYQGKDEDGQPIYDPVASLPVLKYRGTVKLHGTNAGIAISSEGRHYQSRERILTLGSGDNAGFMLNMEEAGRKAAIDALWSHVCTQFRVNGTPADSVLLFGEWCGNGIQAGVGISQLPKMFVIFGIQVDGEWADINLIAKTIQADHQKLLVDLNRNNVYFISLFPTWEMDIDFARPETAQMKLIEITEEVENECPVAKHFGVSGVGEGVVWTSQTEGWRSYDFAFKVKGEKHSVSKVKTLAPVDVEKIEALREFVTYAVTEPRLEWALNNLLNEQQKPMEMRSIGDFIRTVIADVMKEETDTIVSNQIDMKKANPMISHEAKTWFVNKMKNA